MMTETNKAGSWRRVTLHGVRLWVDPDSPHGAKWRGHLTLARGTKTVLAASRTTLADLIQTMDLAVSDAQMADLLALDKAFAATRTEARAHE